MMYKIIKRKIVEFLRNTGLKAQAEPNVVSDERIAKIANLSKSPLKNDIDIKRVEICMLKYKEDPLVIDKAVTNIIHNTDWPFTLNIYDNRPNPPNMAKIWNRLISESTCDYVCIMDSDAYVPKLEPCWLTRMMESIDEVGVVVPLGDRVTGINKANVALNYPSSEKLAGVWTGFCFLLKKQFAISEPFDEDFYLYGQDSEWAKRLTSKYGGIVVRKDVLVQHEHHYSTKKAEKNNELDVSADRAYSGILLEQKSIR